MKRVCLSVAFFLAIHIVNAQSDSIWYKTYTGEIGNMEATLHLCKAGSSYSGYVWFRQLQWPMQIINSQRMTDTDSVQLSAMNGAASLNLTGVFNENNFSGNSTLQKGSASKNAGFQMSLNTGQGFTPFGYYFVQGSTRLPAKLKNESQCDFSSGTVWPINKGALSASLKKEISVLLAIKPNVANPAVSMKAAEDEFFAGWLKDNSKMTPAEASQMGLSLSASQGTNIMVMYEDDRTITLAAFNSAYSGGAHDMYSTSLYNFDKKSGRRLQLKDVLTPAGIRLLPAYLDRAARMQYGITNQKPLDQNNFFVKEIKPTENFYITSDDIGFLYPPYALKSFADGEVNLLVPIQTLSRYLQPAFRK